MNTQEYRKAVFIVLSFGAVFFIISGITYTMIEPSDKWLWISRSSIGLILLGISACIKTENE